MRKNKKIIGDVTRRFIEKKSSYQLASRKQKKLVYEDKNVDYHSA